MPLPIEVLSTKQLHAHELSWGYYYGFFYGFLAALCIYNLLLFTGVGERIYLYYTVVLAAVVFCNLSYTGHGVAWLWPGAPGFQRYVILVSMVAYSALGLLFAARFLSLAEQAPRILRWVRGYTVAGLAAMALSLLLASQLLAALVAFSFTSLFTLSMFMLGVLAVKRGWAYGRYFWAATLFAMLGVAVTNLSVWGKIPFDPITFHATEIGLMLEATLLALALAYRMRQYRQAGLLAWQDPLTGLNNRRAFLELSVPYLSAHERRERPLSVIILDIDHFKQVNDEYGHNAGDDALVAVGKVLARHSRASDIVARWGGEEFILLLAETDLEQAVVYAERLRQAISDIRLSAGNRKIILTASFGIAMRGKDAELEEVIVMADAQLYRAKHEGRNRVCYPPADMPLRGRAIPHGLSGSIRHPYPAANAAFLSPRNNSGSLLR